MGEKLKVGRHMNRSKFSLIGFSGFVGNTLLKQAKFDALYRSTDIADIDGKEFNVVVCSGAPAQKWIANKHPNEDRTNIENLISHLNTIQCNILILISTIDVFNNSIDVDEDSTVEEYDLHSYGLHRRLLEKFIQQRFSRHLIVRLPGLVGPGLRKNVIFDFLNDNNQMAIDSRGIFQFYPMVNLWYDIQIALQAGISLLHLTAEPLSVKEIAEQGFGKSFENHLANPPSRYDMRTRHANLFGLAGEYQYSRRESIQAIRAYAQSEPRTLHAI